MENNTDLSTKNIIVKSELLSSFPVDNIFAADISVPDGFKIIEVHYVRPPDNSTKTILRVSATDENGKMHVINKTINFALSENQRLADAVSVTSFRLKDSIRDSHPPDSLSPLDFVTKYSDLIIASVDYTKPNPNEKEATPILTIITQGTSSIIHLPVPVVFKHSSTENILTTISENDFELSIALNEKRTLIIEYAKYLGSEKIQIIATKLKMDEDNITASFKLGFMGETRVISFSALPYVNKNDLLISKLISRIVIRPGFADSFPPAEINEPFVNYPKELKVDFVRYIPPKDSDSVDAKAEVRMMSNNGIVKHFINFKFAKSLKDEYNLVSKKIIGKNFIYSGAKKLIAPPTSFVLEDFKCDVEGIAIEEIKYDLMVAGQDQHTIKFIIVAAFRGMPFEVEKSMSFKMSYMEHVISSDDSDAEHLSLFTIPKKMSDPLFIKNLKDNPKLMTKRLLSKFLIANVYVGAIVKVSVSKFDVFKDTAEILMIIQKKILNKIITQEILYPIVFQESYAKFMLTQLTDKHISINNKYLTSCPPDNINGLLFKVDYLFEIFGVEYFVPDDSTREVTVVIKVGVKDEFVLIKKNLRYSLTREEYWAEIEEEEDELFISQFDASSLNVHVNVLGEPVINITPDNISGVPEGVKIYTKYKMPRLKRQSAKLIIGLKKGKSIKSFEQIIEFEKPRTKLGTKINLEYTQMMDVRKRRKKV